jgi:tight adherence protein B
LADVVARVAADVSGHVAARREVAAQLAGARSSGALLAGLPVLGLLLGAAMGAHPLTVLIDTPSGQLLALLGVTLDAAGLLWTQQLAGHAERG